MRYSLFPTLINKTSSHCIYFFFVHSNKVPTTVNIKLIFLTELKFTAETEEYLCFLKRNIIPNKTNSNITKLVIVIWDLCTRHTNFNLKRHFIPAQEQIKFYHSFSYVVYSRSPFIFIIEISKIFFRANVMFTSIYIDLHFIEKTAKSHKILKDNICIILFDVCQTSIDRNFFSRWKFLFVTWGRWD